MKRLDTKGLQRHIVLVIAGCALSLAAWPAHGQSQLPMEPLHNSGQSVTGAFEGWFQNPDGSFSLLVGYFNRNTKETIEIPVGPNNHIDPGGPDIDCEDRLRRT